ncbi:MAG: hypothetical protein ACJ74Y_10700 [Bryobacteraceae bacterium]
MTDAQRRMHWRLWGQVKNVLMKGRETWTKHEENQRRHDFYATAGCRADSLTKFDQRDMDLFVGSAMAILQPGNLDAQLRQVRQGNKRALWMVRQLMREMNVNDNYVRGVIEQIEDGVDPNTTDAWQRERERSHSRRDLEQLTVPELKKVASALRSIKRRNQRKNVREYVLKPAMN